MTLNRKTKGEKRRRQREKMFRQWPYCDFCEGPLSLIDFREWKEKNGKEPIPGHAAVLFSNIPKLFRKQKQENNFYTLSCKSCADKISAERCFFLGIDELRKRARRHGRNNDAPQ